MSHLENFHEDYPNVISPNLGHPHFISLDLQPDQPLSHQINEKPDLIFKIFLVGGEKDTPEKLEDKISGHLFLLPLFDHNKVTKRLERGFPIPLRIHNLKEVSCLTTANKKLRDLYGLNEKRISYLLWHDFFGEDKKLFKARVSFSLSQADHVIKWLEEKNFLMFDIQQTYPDFNPNKKRTCYHAVVLKKNEWNSLRFAHITDIHVAKRFDEILCNLNRKMDINRDFSLRQTKNESKEAKTKIAKKVAKRIPDRINPFKPLIERYKNPNNYFRKFICWANHQAKKDDLDFIIASGDIIDYYLKNHYSRMEIYKLEESNWDIFLNIVLNKKIETESDCTPLKIEQQEELAVPIFTSTGNHDVRINGYPLKVSTKIYRNFGLRKKEAKNYQDPFQKHQYKSLMIDKYCLGPYYKHINAFDDYFLKFGNYNFLLLNSGADSFLSLQSLLMADPAGVGFSDKQFNLALNIARREFSEEYGGSLDFIVSHHPVLNPVVKNVIFRKILKFLNLKTWENPEIFKGPQPSNKLHFKFGTISKNWLEMIGLIYQYHAVGLMGHTHRNREIKISLTGKNIEYNKDTKEITNNPFDFIWDDFTEKHRMSYFNQNLPFIFQSPSLGIGRYEDKTSPGRFRYFHLKDNKIWDMKIINLNQD